MKCWLRPTPAGPAGTGVPPTWRPQPWPPSPPEARGGPGRPSPRCVALVFGPPTLRAHQDHGTVEPGRLTLRFGQGGTVPGYGVAGLDRSFDGRQPHASGLHGRLASHPVEALAVMIGPGRVPAHDRPSGVEQDDAVDA